MKCSIEGCDSETKHDGLCGKHYKRRWRHGDPTKTLTPGRGFQPIKCIAEEPCERLSAYACGLCDTHYNMQLNYGRTYKIIRRGESYIDSNGYVRLMVDGLVKYEHVHLAEKALGKPLPIGAVVHHMNGIRNDNHTTYNLVVCPDQAYHLLLHRRAKELGYEIG